jgi:AmmeMemoRadiSam system protein A
VTERAVLARYARDHLRACLGGPPAVPPDAAWCQELAATFVTLRWRDGLLQGCIGTLEPERTIVADVAHNAVAAGTRDSRGKKLSVPHVDELDVEVSILSALEPIASEREIRVGRDGVVIANARGRATFLPVMWARLPELDMFMAALRDKAGFASTSGFDIWRYTVEHHVDRAP